MSGCLPAVPFTIGVGRYHCAVLTLTCIPPHDPEPTEPLQQVKNNSADLEKGGSQWGCSRRLSVMPSIFFLFLGLYLLKPPTADSVLFFFPNILLSGPHLPLFSNDSFCLFCFLWLQMVRETKYVSSRFEIQLLPSSRYKTKPKSNHSASGVQLSSCGLYITTVIIISNWIRVHGTCYD